MCKVTIAIVVFDPFVKHSFVNKKYPCFKNYLFHCIMCRDIIFPRVKFGTKDRKRGAGGKAIFS